MRKGASPAGGRLAVGVTLEAGPHLDDGRSAISRRRGRGGQWLFGRGRNGPFRASRVFGHTHAHRLLEKHGLH